MHETPNDCFRRTMFRLKNGKRWKVLADLIAVSENTPVNWCRDPSSIRLYDLRNIVYVGEISDAEIISWFRGKE